MFNHAGLSPEIRVGAWPECANTAQDIDNGMVSTTRPISPSRQFHEKDPIYMRNLRTFGEIGIVTERQGGQKIKAKLAQRGYEAMFVGYPKNTTGDVYRMMRLSTKQINLTRDILWMDKTY